MTDSDALLTTRALLKRDLGRMYQTTTGSTPSRVIEMYRTPGVHAIIIYRIRRWLKGKNILLRVILTPPLLYLEHRMRSKWGIEIHSGARIEGGFIILHHGGIFISSHSTIGKNFSIAHDVTIGTDGRGNKLGAPTIGDNVAINPGAKVHGKIRIGNNVHIGPNAVVNRNVPDNALVHVRSMQVAIFPSLYGTGENITKKPD
jgi:serine O-acetyltransferase